MCTSDDDRLIATAFINPDNTIATVVLNQTDHTEDFKVWIDGRAVTAHTPAHSIESVVLSK
jgi:glucosylceramidase